MTKQQCKHDCEYRNSHSLEFGPDMPEYSGLYFGENFDIDRQSSLYSFPDYLSCFDYYPQRFRLVFSEPTRILSSSDWERAERVLQALRLGKDQDEAIQEASLLFGRFDSVDETTRVFRRRKTYSKKMKHGYTCHD